MRRILGFLSLIALSILAAGALGVAGLGPLAGKTALSSSASSFTLDYRSLLAGTVLGVVLSSIGRLGWADLPRRVIAWIYANERKLIRCGYAAMLLGVLLFY
jgi:hypothetical protein